CTAERCISDGMPYGYHLDNAPVHFSDCVATNFASGGFFSASSGSLQTCRFCYAANGTGGGFQGVNCDRCISYNNSGVSSDGFISQSQGNVHYINCVAYGNGRSGFRVYQDARVENCIAVNNTAYGFDAVAAGNIPVGLLLNSAGFNNTS